MNTSTIPSMTTKSLTFFLTERKDLLYTFIMKKINGSLDEKDVSRVDLFRVTNTNYVASILRKDFDKVLQDALGYFVANEQYEKAARCRDLLNRVHCNELLESLEKNNG